MNAIYCYALKMFKKVEIYEWFLLKLFGVCLFVLQKLIVVPR